MSTLLTVLCLAILLATLAIKVLARPGRARRLRLLHLGMVGGIALLFLAPSLANAADAVTPVGIDTSVNVDLGFIELDAYLVQLIAGIVIPFLIAYFSAPGVKPWLAKTATIILGAITGLITVGMNDAGGSVISVEALKAAAQTASLALVAYFLTIRNSAVEARLNEAGPDLLPAAKVA